MSTASVLNPEKRIELNPFDVDAWNLLLRESSARSIDQARNFYEKLVEQFPNAGRYWKAYIEHELRAKNFDRVEQLFDRCLFEVLHIDLWKSYVFYIRETKGHLGNYREKVAEAFDCAIDRVGVDTQASQIYLDYIQFLKNVEAVGQYAENQKVAAVRKIYQKALSTPLANLDQIWQDYCAFEKSVNMNLAEKLIADRLKDYQHVKKVYKQIEQIMQGINRQAISVPPRGTAAEQKQVDLWRKYIAFEKSNPLRTEELGLKAKRVIYAYDQALLSLGYHADIWYESACYHEKIVAELKDQGDTKVADVIADETSKLYNRATSGLMKETPLIHFAHADFEEAKGRYEVAKQIYDKLINFADDPTLAYIMLMNFVRRTEGVRAARAVFQKARCDQRCQFHIYIAGALMEFHCSKDVSVAQKIFDYGLKQFGNIPEFATAYVDFLTHVNDDNNTRVVIERLLDSPEISTELRIDMWDRYLDLETRVGNAASLHKVDKARRQALNEVYEDRQALFLVDRFKFMNLWPCDSEQLKLMGYGKISRLNTQGASNVASASSRYGSLANPRIPNVNIEISGFPRPDTAQMIPFKAASRTEPSFHPVPGGLFPAPPSLAFLAKKLPPPESFNGPFVDHQYLMDTLLHFNREPPKAKFKESIEPNQSLSNYKAADIKREFQQLVTTTTDPAVLYASEEYRRQRKRKNQNESDSEDEANGTAVESTGDVFKKRDSCDRNDPNWYAVYASRHHFLYCHPKHGVYVRDQCGMVNGERKIFDSKLQQCVFPVDSNNGPLYAPLSTLLKCTSSLQCHDDRWFCTRKGRCACKRNFVQIGTQCWKKLTLDTEEECVFDRQCSATWPTARCLRRKCICPSPQVAVQTYHGTVCSLPDSCPMGLQTSVLHRTINCHLKGGCGDDTSLSQFYDCVHFGGSTSMCCPNKAHTCMQPMMPGNGPGHFMRYYYDAPTDSCRSFVFRGGNMVNTNVFQSRIDCEVYCRSDCPIGLMEKGSSDGPIYCDSDEDCGEKYGCHKRDQNDKGVCCPLPSWICSADGGVEYGLGEKRKLEEYDVGVTPKHVTAVFYPVIRYYYSLTEQRCKAFMYQGEGGNFNHFENIEHCQQFCSPVVCEGEKALVLEGKTVGCGPEEPCVPGFQCKHGLCCPVKADFCLPGYEVSYEIDDEGNSKGRPLQCKHDADCPGPNVCQLTNRIMRTSLRGYCCRKLESKISRFSKRIKTTATTSISTTTPLTTPSTPSEVSMQVTASTTTLVACPGGRLPLIDKYGRSIECKITENLEEMVRGCGGSPEHQCAFHSVNSTSGICCSRLQYEQNRCTGGTRPMIEVKTRFVKPCSPVKYDSCPGDDSICVFDELYGDYHCCHPIEKPPVLTTIEATTITTVPPRTQIEEKTTLKSNSTTEKPNFIKFTTEKPEVAKFPQENNFGCLLGQEPFQDPLGNETLECNPNIFGTCPPGFNCQKSKRKLKFICCGITSVCPKNSAAFINPVSQSPVSCSLSTGCPESFFCFKSPYLDSGSSGICCSQDPVASLCDHGLALMTREGKAVKCSESNSCQRGYTCLARFNMSFCCPSIENVCSQPLNTGLSCEEAPPQAVFYFDIQSKTCQQFQFSGCSGNDNRFESFSSCQSHCKLSGVCSIGYPLIQLNGKIATCSEENSCLAGYSCVFTSEGNFCCPKPEMTCSLPKDPGTSCGPSEVVHSQNSLAWHFSTKESSCVPFEYRGCGGNYNRFSSQQHCSLSCLHALCPNGHPKMKDGKLVRCGESGGSRSSGGCESGYICVSPKFGVPEINICCPRPEVLCLQPEEKEPECSISKYRFRFDPVQERCVKFVHSGCFGSGNSFDSMEECNKICSIDVSVCPKGSEIYVMPDSKRAMSCSPQEPACPSGYRCQPSSDGILHFCCSEPRCPSGKMPLISNNGTGVHCQIGHFGFFDGCPDDYSCQQTSTGRFMCCPKAKSDEACPYPSRPFLHTPDSLPMVCNERYGSCSFGYACHYNKAFREHFCCSELGSVAKNGRRVEPLENIYAKDLCDDGNEPITDDYGVVRICNPHLSYSCPDDYECQFNGAVGRYHCCKKSGSSTPAREMQLDAFSPFFDSKNACPGGLNVKLHPKTGQPIVCQPEVPNYCPLFSRCEYSPAYWQFICCTSADAVEPFSEALEPPTSPPVGYYPGQAGCLADEQCHATFPGSFCHDWICRCPGGMKIHDKNCVPSCPPGHEDREGLCAKIFVAA